MPTINKNETKQTIRLASLVQLLLATVCSAAQVELTTPGNGGRQHLLSSGNATLAVTALKESPAAVCVTLSHAAGPPFAFRTAEPLSLQVLDSAGAASWLSGGYSSAARSGQSLRCIGELRSPAGSRFQFTDTYRPAEAGDSFLLTREVTVRTPAAPDAAFLSRFSLSAATPAPLREHDFFIPGIWYRDNTNMPARALAADLTDDYFIIREDRMPLPLVMMRDKGSGATLTLIHSAPDGSTCLADYQATRVVDGRIQVASLGVFGQDNATLAFYYPAAEGERSYLRGGAPRGPAGAPGGRGQTPSKRWVERFHPVQLGVKHSYQILIQLSRHPDFPKAMRQSWRTAFDHIHPSVAPADLPAAYEAGIKLIADWSKSTKGAPGLPFRLSLPKGELEHPRYLNYQMGFVGQQLPLAYHLLRYGLLNQNDEIRRKGEAMVDFWATNSLTPSGLPRTWYDTYPEPHWRPHNTFLRVASDGMVGAELAYDFMKRYGHDRPEWLKFCQGFGDWLIHYQNPDGTWYREYKIDSTPNSTGKQNTPHPIRFLIDLHRITGEQRYLDCALRAAKWCWTNVHQAFSYVGGTADNPNVIDKEAGFLALDAFLALHDVTGEKRWLEAAAQAADFTETWAYSWNIPIPPEDERATYPKGATSTAFSIIATGHSGADLFLAGAPFFYYRLYLQTGDAHYADMARQFLCDTKQGMDINGSLGYGHTGLCTEALSLAPPRGHGVNVWLPWLTHSMIEPIVKLQDAYGMMDTPTVGPLKLEELRAKDREFGRTRGLFAGGAR